MLVMFFNHIIMGVEEEIKNPLLIDMTNWIRQITRIYKQHGYNIVYYKTMNSTRVSCKLYIIIYIYILNKLFLLFVMLEKSSFAERNVTKIKNHVRHSDGARGYRMFMTGRPSYIMFNPIPLRIVVSVLSFCPPYTNAVFNFVHTTETP